MKNHHFLISLICILLSLSCAAQTTSIPKEGEPNTTGYGPNGNHWPRLIPTPDMRDSKVPNQIVVDCSWTAISTAIKALTADQVNSGVVIRVKPGSLTGNGSGASSTPVLSNLGDPTWKQRVTVSPLGDYGAITVTSAARFYNLTNINISGFIFYSLNFSGSSNSALSWSFIQHTGTFYGANVAPYPETSNFELCEVVVGIDAEVNANDRSDIYTGGGNISHWLIEGCYFAPNQRPAGSTAHTDTLQFAPVNGGTISDITIKDSVFYASDNSCVQTGTNDILTFDHTYLCAGPTARKLFPYLTGSTFANGDYVLNGAGSNFTAQNLCIFIGGESINTSTTTPQPWLKISNTTLSSIFSISGTTPIYGTLGTSPQEGVYIVATDIQEPITRKFTFADTMIWWGPVAPQKVSGGIIVK